MSTTPISAVAARKQKNAAPSKTSEIPSTSSSNASSSSESSASESDSDSSDSSSDSDSDSDSVTSEYMNSLLEAAKKNLSARAKGKQKEENADVMLLGEEVEDKYVLVAFTFNVNHALGLTKVAL